jgi:hypothetical protein
MLAKQFDNDLVPHNCPGRWINVRYVRMPRSGSIKANSGENFTRIMTIKILERSLQSPNSNPIK